MNPVSAPSMTTSPTGHLQPPVMSYLFALAVNMSGGPTLGYPRCIRGTGIVVASFLPDTWMRSSYHQKQLAFYEEQFDQTYPYTSTIKSLFLNSTRDMENIGAVTILEDYIFRSPVPQATVSAALSPSCPSWPTWFGNLVTMKWWDDLWLSDLL